ncbi:MAG: hypothetical protein K2N73_01760 [Lachnospiraceae bacterium]|nr:hypothetical protein [Lachnospiraceae bacterium]
MKIKLKLMATVFISVLLMGLITGCDALMETDEKIQAVVDAYKSVDSEAFFKKMESDSASAAGMECFFDSVKSGNTEGMNAVYQRVHELTKDVEVSVEKTDSYDVNVTIKTKDASKAIEDAMLAAAAEGPEAFADMPSWLLKGLDNAVDKELTCTFNSRNPDLKGFSMASNHKFLEALTAGAYPYLGCTMTTCIDSSDDSSYYMIANSDIVHYSTDYYFLYLEGLEYTESDLQELEAEISKELVDSDGIKSGIIRGDNYLAEYMYINYDEASNFTLSQLGLVDSSDRSADISLEATISGFEDEGMTCETTDFGSGIIEKRKQK